MSIFHLNQIVLLEIELNNLMQLLQTPSKLIVCNTNSFYDFADIDNLIFFTFLDNFTFFVDSKNLSKPPL